MLDLILKGMFLMKYVIGLDIGTSAIKGILADENENIEAEILANETLEMMLAILPEEQRWAVVEHIIKGVPKTKLAQIKKVSDAAIGQQIKRALNTLRKKFSTFFDYPV